LTAYLCAELTGWLPAPPTPKSSSAWPAATEWGGLVVAGLIIRLIIQTIRQDPSGAVSTDEAPNVSRPDLSGADQTDAEHQATDLAVGVRIAAGTDASLHQVDQRLRLRAGQRPLGHLRGAAIEQTPLGYRATR
jgi:hypothetical protein